MKEKMSNFNNKLNKEIDNLNKIVENKIFKTCESPFENIFSSEIYCLKD
jgi:hypothetical protein